MVRVADTPSPREFKRDDSVGYRHEIIPPDRADDCPYLERWVMGVGRRRRGGDGKDVSRAWFSIRLHHFFRSDEDALHDHPTWFITLVLRGCYEDRVGCPACAGRGEFQYSRWVEMPSGLTPATGWKTCNRCDGTGQIVGDRMTPGKIRFRPALHAHRVVTSGCWTLCLFGPKKRDWGFFAPEGWIRQRAYFKRYGGSAACE